MLITLLNTSLFAITFLFIAYCIFCLLHKKLIVPKFRRLFFYITIFSLFGVVGEVFVNILYTNFIGSPLWEYRLFPSHNASISYFFIFVWGSLGLYKYLSDHTWTKGVAKNEILAGLIMGAEAIIIELLYNGVYFLIFDDYIFYYFPSNLGIFSHFSCLQVIPFYFIVGLVLNNLIRQHDQTELVRKRDIAFLYAFYWMIIVTFVFLI